MDMKTSPLATLSDPGLLKAGALIAGERVRGTLRFAVDDPATEVPFGGAKQSGLGREGSHHSMDDPAEVKTLCLGDILK